MEWISVKDRLPDTVVVDNEKELSETVFALDISGFRYIGHFEKFRYDNGLVFCGTEVEERSYDNLMEVFDGHDISQWMPLPEPPEV